MRTPLKTLNYSEPHSSPSPELSPDGDGDGVNLNFSGEAVSGSGRSGEEEPERYIGYEPRTTTRFESRWAWGWSGSRLSEERSRSPERRDFSNWRSCLEGDDDDDDEEEEEEGVKGDSDSPPTHVDHGGVVVDDETEERSRSPERRLFWNWRMTEEEDRVKKLSDSPPVRAVPSAVVVGDEHEPAFRVGAGITNLGNWRMSEEEDRVKKLCDSPPVRAVPSAVVVDEEHEPAFRVGAGLTNLGNTCYMNAVLQCLTHTRPLTEGLFTIKHYSPCLSDDFCLTCTLRELVGLSFSKHDEIAPYEIAANLKYFSPDFVRFRQEDAHEFMQCMLNMLERYPVGSSDPFSVAPVDNLVKQVFGGSLVSRLQCTKCYHISCTPEDLIDFSLEIDDVSTLDEALGSFTKLEKIEDIKLTCDSCNEKVLMEKQLMVDNAPLVASFHMKRFKNDGTTVEKIKKHIEYPLSLNLQPYTVKDAEHNAGLIYDLYAVVVHSGYSSCSGHYFCYVRSSPSTWHVFDDEKVIRVSESHVLSREAYILFYAKHDNSWFSNTNDVQSRCSLVISPDSVLDNVNQFSGSDSSTENPHKFDVRLSGYKSFSEATCQTACYGSEQGKIEVHFENKGHGKYSDLLLNDKDDKIEVDVADSSFTFDMLLNTDEKENKTCIAEDTNDSSLNFDMLKDDANKHREEVGNSKNNKTTISPDRSISQAGSIGSLETANVNNRVLRKRSTEKLAEDPRKKQVIKTLKGAKMNISNSRVKKLLAPLTVPPNKSNKNALHPPACSRKPVRVNPSVRSAVFR